MEKPVIILGGGIWGSLLAWRLKERLPEIQFRLYEKNSTLGNNQSCSFRESDCKHAITWLRPIITGSWSQHHIKFRKFERWMTDSYHLIDSKKLHEVVSEKISSDLRLNNHMTMEMALQEGSFVIDARNICHYKKAGYKKCLRMEIELTENHHLIAPVVFDEGVERKDLFRNIRYLPLNENTLLIKDYWYSDNKNINIEEMRRALHETIQQRGWKVKRVLREECNCTIIPLSQPIIRQEGRVINLAGISHDLTGCSIPAATKLIDKMVSTSFRFGELKEVVTTFRKEIEHDSKFFRFLNKQLLEDNQHELFEAIYKQPYPIIERFSRGNLNTMDRLRILIGKTNYQTGHLFQLLIPFPKLLKVSNS